MKYTVFEYLNLSAQDKLDYFMETRSVLNFLANYWVDFDTVKENVSTFDSPDLYTLDYLIGKDDKTINAFFTERNDLLLLIPKLLGIRENKLNNCYLTVQDEENIEFYYSIFT